MMCTCPIHEDAWGGQMAVDPRAGITGSCELPDVGLVSEYGSSARAVFANG